MLLTNQDVPLDRIHGLLQSWTSSQLGLNLKVWDPPIGSMGSVGGGRQQNARITVVT